MDLPKVPELSGSRLAETKKDLAALGIVISDLGASARMHEKDKAVRDQQLDEGRRFIDLAQALSRPVREDVRGQAAARTSRRKT